jgi:hypothetical protein
MWNPESSSAGITRRRYPKETRTHQADEVDELIQLGALVGVVIHALGRAGHEERRQGHHLEVTSAPAWALPAAHTKPTVTDVYQAGPAYSV